jgi:hypothetical protein
LALVRADLVESMKKLEEEGLTEVGRDARGRYLYADVRRPSLPPDGCVGAASKLDELPSGVNLLFHPFRYYVLCRLVDPLRPNITPISTLTTAGVESYRELAGWCLEQFQRHAGAGEFLGDVERLNDVTTLAVVTEPATFQRVFQTLRTRTYDYSELGLPLDEVFQLMAEERTDLLADFVRQQIVEHQADVSKLYAKAGVERIEEEREMLCRRARLLDPNKDVQTMLRLAPWRARLDLKGNTGGAVYLRTMAEMLRRQAEETFDIWLPEEDDVGSIRPRDKRGRATAPSGSSTDTAGQP